MKSAILHLFNLISSVLPQTRAFGIRRIMYRAAGVQVGKRAKINGGVRIQFPNVDLGDDTWVGRRTEFAPSASAQIAIGSNCDVSQDVLFVTGSHLIGDSRKRAGDGTNLPIVVGAGTWIGARVTVLGGTSIGEGSVIAAGSLVRGEFPPNVMLAGTPAKVVRKLDGGKTE